MPFALHDDDRKHLLVYLKRQLKLGLLGKTPLEQQTDCMLSPSEMVYLVTLVEKDIG